MRWRKRRRADGGREPFVIGKEMAQAREAEVAHRAARPGSVSPLDGLGYDRGAGAFDFARFVPSATDEAIRERLEGWQPYAGDVRDDLTMDDLYTLIAFAQRATVRSLGEDGPGWAAAGVLALPLVACDRVDWRDLTVAAGMVAWALGRTGHDVPGVLRRAAGDADEQAAAILHRFADDPPASLDDWGYRVVTTRAGTGLAPSRFEPYEPSVDLLAAAVALAEVLGADRYLADGITVATALPDVWCRGPHHEAVRAALDRSRACVSVSADPRPRDGVSPGRQMFVVWIVEMADAAVAEVVARAALAAPGDHVRLALHDGPVCGVLVARSVQQGVAALETPATIERFGSALRDALRLAHGEPGQSAP